MSTATILVAHGSRDPRSAAVVHNIALAAGMHPSFLEFNAPHPCDIADELLEGGHRTLRLVPLLLTDAYHSTVDLPAVAADVRNRHPDTTVELAPAIGDTSLAHSLTRALPPLDAVVVSAAGTSMEHGRAHVAEVARTVGNLLEVPVSEAFATGPGRRPDEAVRQLRSDGAERVGALHYFIAPGLLCDLAAEQARDAGACFLGHPLGPSRELLRLLERSTVPHLEPVP
ncbi:sirohydrochlorin chelatase [Haloglycomyces albus]|uniref:sirohydrochlorin chelatase n=1 Tax=Haloglycomyces albus TaxID=526067 RepID=UPI0004B840C0|nr:CbiX/SirB N-terminal domain-containing protein [Haloglycomyces albus]